MLIIIPALKHVAQRINLTDRPGSRKLHSFPVPLIGGIAILISMFFTFLLSTEIRLVMKDQLVLFMSSILIAIIGLIDDKFDISAKYKLLVELIIGFSMASAGFRITSFYGFLGIQELPVFIQYAFTVTVTTGVINAFNLMDGVDGLVGELALIGFVIILLSSIAYGQQPYLPLYAAFIGALSGFLKFNLNKNKIFMGDAGSLWLGHILINTSIHLLKHTPVKADNHPLLPLIIIGYFLVPVLDSLRVYLGRMKKGNSPFKADNTHLHHLLLLTGFSHKKVSFMISTISVVILMLGVFTYEYTSLTIAVIVVICLFCTIAFVLNLFKKLLIWRERIRVMENG
jgi:UDP-GlcNAc:undecaprenyl-phosphate GlcNAc-1-phosphate transferase